MAVRISSALLLCRTLGAVPPPVGNRFSGVNGWGWDAQDVGNERFFEQRQDHFDERNLETWQQAYYVNDTFWRGSNSEAPAFLYIGGEGPLGNSSVTRNFVVDQLPRNGGLIFGVEHRYYGCVRNVSSCPYTNGTERHLRFLSSRQALADLASFRDYAVKKYGISSKAPWIAIGGSYPGMLAAFARAVYPDRFHSAVASSAPVRGILDMTVFEDVVSSAYAVDVEGVEGSPTCRDAIARGHQAVRRNLQEEAGRQLLHRMFPTAVESLEWLEDPDNQRVFAGCGVASFPAQANNPKCHGPGCGISQICSIMVNESLGEPLQRLAALRAAQDSTGLRMTQVCEMDWEMPGDAPTSFDEVSANAYWGYQTCTEFGFYQTCELGSDCFFSQGLVSFQNPHHKPNDFCSGIFGLSTDETVKRIEDTNQYYYKKIAEASRIIWVNGNVDPWHGRSHMSPPGPEQAVIFPVEGASHCAWMRSRDVGDQGSLVAARQEIFAQLGKWLQPPEQLVV